MFSRPFKLYFIDVIKGKHYGFFSEMLKGILFPFSWIFQLGVFLRNWAYNQGLFKTYKSPIPLVISIGNIVAGGTGKTPFTLMLAGEMEPLAMLAILSRGYHSKAEKYPFPVVVSFGKGPVLAPDQCGDEPYLLSRNLPKSMVIVGKNRNEAAKMAAQMRVQIALLDDGMQCRSLARQYEIVLLNAYDPFGQGYFLPRGFLRDSPRSLSRANLVVVNHVQDSLQYSMLKKQLREWTSAPIIGTRLALKSIQDAQSQILEGIQGKRVALFSGIAHPGIFLQTVKELGADIVQEQVFEDHHAFDRKDLVEISTIAVAMKAECLLCTEKDFVKIADLIHDLPLPLYWLQMKMNVVEDKDHWVHFLSDIRTFLEAEKN